MAKRRAKRARVKSPPAKEDAAAPPAKKEPTLDDNDQPELSVFEGLPELVHTRIIQLLNIADRLSLGATSRKMRMIEAANEFRRFARVSIKVKPSRFDFLLHCPTGHSWPLGYGRNNSARYNQIVSFFKRAIIHRMDLKISGPTKMMCDDLLTIFRSVRMKMLDIQVTDLRQPFFIEFFSKLVVSSGVKQIRMEFIDVTKEVLVPIRLALQQLPRLNSVDLTWNHPLSGVFDQGVTYGYPIDLQVILSLMRRCSVVEIGYSSKLTAVTILKIAQECEKWPTAREVNVISKKSIVKKLENLLATRYQNEFNKLPTQWASPDISIERYMRTKSGVGIMLWKMSEDYRTGERIIPQLGIRVRHLSIPELSTEDFYRCNITSYPTKPFSGRFGPIEQW